MTEQCAYCGNKSFETNYIPYLYQHQGNYLLVPDMPTQVCTQCGMEYFSGPDLERVERHFFAIQRQEEQPDRVVTIPVKRYAA
jgi:YgiT-type zinc finger domain-containing protein